MKIIFRPNFLTKLNSSLQAASINFYGGGSNDIDYLGSKKVSFKFGVYEIRASSEFQLVIACLLFLNMTSQLSMVKILYLYSSK